MRGDTQEVPLTKDEAIISNRAYPSSHPLPTFDLGVASYLPVQELQARLRLLVAEGVRPGVLLLLEHDPVITLGKRGVQSDLRDALRAQREGIAVVRSERGGQTTLHAPGQLISYLILPIPRHDLQTYVHNLEEILVRLLAARGVPAVRRSGHPGLYVGGQKIASVGLRCQHWVASHGTALNVDIDLSLFDLITSCGEPYLRQTSLRAVSGHACAMDAVKASYVEAFQQVLGLEVDPPLPLSYEQVEAALDLARPTP
jgi:lipoate-protein ligase B